jgi:hypothetical protein
MQNNASTLSVGIPRSPKVGYSRSNQLDIANYAQAENQLGKLFEKKFEHVITTQPSLIESFQETLSEAIPKAFAVVTSAPRKTPGSHLAHRFLQQILYRINQIDKFNSNRAQPLDDQSFSYLYDWRSQIERVWQRWELAQFEQTSLQNVHIEEALSQRVKQDSEAPISENARFFRTQMTQAGYCRLLAIAPLDGLAAVSHLCRTLNAKNDREDEQPTLSELTQLWSEENSGGVLNRPLSTYFTKMLAALGMNTELSTYHNLVPWEVLALLNHNFLLTRHRHHLLRYMGGLLCLEASVPIVFTHYQIAARRLGLPSIISNYWNLHTRLHTEDGHQLLEKVLPLINQYPNDAWELVLGYDQQRTINNRALAAIASSVRAAERAERAIAKSLQANDELELGG